MWMKNLRNLPPPFLNIILNKACPLINKQVLKKFGYLKFPQWITEKLKTLKKDLMSTYYIYLQKKKKKKNSSAYLKHQYM